MYIFYAVLSAVFAGVMSILAKIGIDNVNSNVATLIRTVFIVFLSWIIVILQGHLFDIYQISIQNYLFLFLSGAATGVSWLFYFKALQMTDATAVAAIDKSSVVLTIIFSFIILGEKISYISCLSIVLISIGTYFLIDINKTHKKPQSKLWFFYAFLSAVFAGLTSIFGKIGVNQIDTNVATAIRTLIILGVSIIIVLFQHKFKEILIISVKNWIFLFLSGLATGFSWIYFYKALALGKPSVVVPIDKLSIVFTLLLSTAFLHESISFKKCIGIVILVIGTVLITF